MRSKLLIISYISAILFTILPPSAESTPSVVKSYECFEQSQFKLCLPHIGKDKNIIALSSLDSSLILDALQGYLGESLLDGIQDIHDFSDTENDMLSDFPGNKFYRINDLFGSFIGSNYNQRANFSGPNCYNTSLIASGILTEEELRYISPQEFENLLNQYFKVIDDKPKFGDLILYNSEYKRDHVAFYLFNGLVFHKKDVDKHFYYRIVPIYSVFRREPNEWVPGPFDDERPFPDMSVDMDKIAIYRVKDRFPETVIKPTQHEYLKIKIINGISSAVIKYAPDWAIGKMMGIAIENLVSELVREFSDLKLSKAFESRLSYSKLVSIRDQMFKSIEETHFSSRYASMHADRIRKEICFHNNSFTKQLITDLMIVYGNETNVDMLESLLQTALSLNKAKCNFSLLNIIKNR